MLIGTWQKCNHWFKNHLFDQYYKYHGYDYVGWILFQEKDERVSAYSMLANVEVEIAEKDWPSLRCYST